MVKRTMLIAALAAVCGVAFADSLSEFKDRLRASYTLMEQGSTEKAVSELRDLQIDQPDSDLVAYSLATAKYKQGLLDMKNEAPEDAVTRFTAARDSFTELYMSEDPFVRFNAAYNAANCSSAIAKNSIALGQHEETVAAFESAIGEYEGLLDRNPEHEGVRQNLNHMRYLLKTLLQNPPPEQEQESGEGDEEDQEQEGDEENEQEQALVTFDMRQSSSLVSSTAFPNTPKV